MPSGYFLATTSFSDLLPLDRREQRDAAAKDDGNDRNRIMRDEPGHAKRGGQLARSLSPFSRNCPIMGVLWADQPRRGPRVPYGPMEQRP